MLTIAPRTMNLFLTGLRPRPEQCRVHVQPLGPGKLHTSRESRRAPVPRHIMLERRMPFEVLRAEFDAFGYDVVLEANGVMRHVQLKAARSDGTTRTVEINTTLVNKPGGCVVWIMVDPDTFTLGPFYWFGGDPGQPLPELGNRIARHSRGEEGEKKPRPAIRVLRRTGFRRFGTLAELGGAMFGPVKKDEAATSLGSDIVAIDEVESLE